ncbi:MAG TPA: hypothetical protein VLC46_08665 [Thermoanaerobaculia bacterium]|jgi:hypothetical protein|nr:hypothetical protein [Thermoanaerobaculia bacterium]
MNRSERLLIILAVPAIAARLLQLAGLHPLVWDEIEFFRATDWVRQGLVPYRDFWEHHTPLQWFLYAPFAALTHSPGAQAIIFMRFAQIPLWIATFVLLMRWMERAGIVRWARWTAIIVALCSSLFMLPAVEYRVDALGCFFVILAIYLVQRIDDGVVYAIFAGAAFCLAGFANLRLGPVIAIAVLLIRIVRPGERRWGGNVRAGWIYAGAAATFLLGALYFVVTNSAAIAFRRVWSENFMADRLAPAIPGVFLYRLAVQIGVHRLIDRVEFDPSGIDPAGIIVLVAGLTGVVRILLRRWRTPDDHFYLAFLAAANLLFIAAMKFIYNYHFEIVVLTFIPFVAMEIERFVPRKVAIGVLAVLLCISAAVGTFRGKESDTRYQDQVMRDVDRDTAPESKVWDSVGWALRRKPAYRYWFLRMIVNELEAKGTFEPYTASALLADPPAAVIADHDTRGWMFRHRQLGQVVVTHYLPAEIELWLPGLSGRVLPGNHIEWIVPADGTYTIYASPRLASHPWFRQPLYFDTATWHDRATVAIRPGDAVEAAVVFTVNGVAVPAGTRRLALHRHDRLSATNTSLVPIGIMLPLVDRERLFQLPPTGVTLEGSASPRWHIPDLSVLAYGDE